MREIVLNERKWIEEKISAGSLGSNCAETVYRLAKYYASCGLNGNALKTSIEMFMLRCDPRISIPKYQALIDKAADSAAKYKMLEIDSVPITRSEIAAIKALGGKNLQRLYFALLCLAKYGNALGSAIGVQNNNWVNQNQTSIFELANVSVSSKRRALMFNDLWTSHYIEYSKIIDNINVSVNMIDPDPDPDDVVMRITEFRDLGNKLMMYFGERYITCKGCGAVVKPASNHQVYCRHCANAIRSHLAVCTQS